MVRAGSAARFPTLESWVSPTVTLGLPKHQACLLICKKGVIIVSIVVSIKGLMGKKKEFMSIKHLE